MIVVGIDCGVTGAVAAVDSRGGSDVRDLPIRVEGGAKMLDARALLAMLREFIPAGEAGTVVIEDIVVRRIAGRTMSHGTETKIVGIRFGVQAVAEVARLTVHAVSPKAWKKAFGLGAEKGASLTVARALFPGAGHMLARVKDHNRAEALLLAQFGRDRLV